MSPGELPDGDMRHGTLNAYGYYGCRCDECRAARREKHHDAADSEQDFQTQVIDLARRFGWRLFHARPGKTAGGRWATQMSGDVGYPDLTLVRGDQLIFAELKSALGGTTLSQVAWLEELGNVEHTTAQVWRPHDLETVAELLRRR